MIIEWVVGKFNTVYGSLHSYIWGHLTLGNAALPASIDLQSVDFVSNFTTTISQKSNITTLFTTLSAYTSTINIESKL